MNASKILFAIQSETCYFKLIGELRYNLSHGFDFIVRRELSNKKTVNFILDLSESEYLDSTNLGIIGMIAAGLKNKTGQKAKLIRPNADILTILESIGFDRLFEISENKPIDKINYQDTALLEIDKKNSKDLVLESHKTLVEMSPYNKEKFIPVIDAILKKKK